MARRGGGRRPYHQTGVEEARRVINGNAVDLFGRVEVVAMIEEADGVPVRVYRPAAS